MSTPVRLRGFALVPLAAMALAACGAGEPPAPVDAPAEAPPHRPPPMAEEKMTLERQVLAAKADLAQRLGASPDEIEVVEARQVTWPDTSLGCPEPGMMYAQVLTPGVLVRLLYAGDHYRYHGGRAALPRLCPAGQAHRPVDAPGAYE